jgi:hypothetical protein
VAEIQLIGEGTVIQTSLHIFTSCHNAIDAYKVLDNYSSHLDNSPFIRENVTALINRLLYLNRNKRIKREVFIYAIDNRLDDLRVLNQRKLTSKNLSDINKTTLSGQ